MSNFEEVIELFGNQFKYDYWTSFSESYKYMEEYILT